MDTTSGKSRDWSDVWPLNKSCQLWGAFTCAECAFRTDRKEALYQHKLHHSADLPEKCPYCTFASKSQQSLHINHIYRVHPEKCKTSAKNSQANNPTDKTCVQMPGTTGGQNLDEKVNRIDVELSCLCGQRLPVGGNVSSVECAQCKNWFHMECFGFTQEEKARMFQEEEKWYCHHCAFEYLKKTSYFSSDDGRLDLPNLESAASAMTETRPPIGQPSSPFTPKSNDSTICRSEILELAQEITLIQKTILSTTIAFKEERDAMLMARSIAAKDLHMEILVLEKEDRRQTNKLVVLVKFGEQLQHQRKELLAAKMLLDPDIGKMITTASYSDEELHEKNLKLSDLAEKLDAIEEECFQLAARIQGANELKEDAFLKLSKARADLDIMERNSATEEPSATALQLKALMHDQHTRIQRFASLEKNLTDYFKHELDEIRQMKEGWLDALNGCGDV